MHNTCMVRLVAHECRPRLQGAASSGARPSPDWLPVRGGTGGVVGLRPGAFRSRCGMAFGVHLCAIRLGGSVLVLSRIACRPADAWMLCPWWSLCPSSNAYRLLPASASASVLTPTAHWAVFICRWHLAGCWTESSVKWGWAYKNLACTWLQLPPLYRVACLRHTHIVTGPVGVAVCSCRRPSGRA